MRVAGKVFQNLVKPIHQWFVEVREPAVLDIGKQILSTLLRGEPARVQPDELGGAVRAPSSSAWTQG
jgi:hypothetical protein